MNIKSDKRVIYFTCLILGGLALIVFFNKQGIDHQSHIKFAQTAVHQHVYPPHYLYHLTLNALTGFSGDYNRLDKTARILLTIAVFLKMCLSVPLIKNINSDQPKTLVPVIVSFILVVLFFISPIINWWQFPYIYRGQFSANLWHNPTIVILMPFCLGVLICLSSQNHTKIQMEVLGSLLLGLSVLIKPNFAMVLLPALFVMTLFKMQSLKSLIIYAVPSVGILSWQFFSVYLGDGESVQSIFRSKVIIDPMMVWSYFSKTPVGSLLVSFAFPAFFLYAFREMINNKKMHLMAWILILIALAEFILLAEKSWPGREYAGNFIWGTVPALYFLFMISIVELIQLKPKMTTLKQKAQYGICCILLAMHFFSGIMFYVRSVMDFDFYA